MRILVNNIHSTNSTSLVILLKRITSIPLEVFGSDVAPLGYTAASTFVDKYFQSPSMDDPLLFTQFLISLCMKEHIDLIIPSSDKEVRYWALYAPHIPVAVFVPGRNIVELFGDKLLATQAVKKAAIDTPKIVTNLFVDNLGKVIFRKRVAVSSQGIDIVNFSNEKYIPNHFSSEWFAQEFIDGTEYSVDVFCDKNGNPKIIIPKKKIEMRAGTTFRSQLVNHPGIISACNRLYQEFNVPGFSDVEFIEANGKLYFIEMNLRLSASAICAIIGSFNYIEQYLEHFYFRKELECTSHYMDYVCWDSIVTRYYDDAIHLSSEGKS